LWEFVFGNNGKVEKMRPSSFTFGRIVRSDGVGASVVYSRAPTDDEIKDAKRAVNEEVNFKVARYEPGSLRTPLEILEALKRENKFTWNFVGELL